MEIILIIAVYILGCVLAYGRLFAMELELRELTGIKTKMTFADWKVISLSWLSFFLLCIAYSVDDDKYFIKFK